MNMDFKGAGMQVVNGFLFGSGLILAAVAFRLVFHVGFCG
jgi:hypothetical protein